ncbi:glycosyltransferase [Bacillus sp. JJ1562]|uniref:glycosyltransferase n=1 Tax=Bacillus sp. JJ1562 TaxID=3122960 RepID=UPI00300232E1
MTQSVMLLILNSSYGGAEKHVMDIVNHMDCDKVKLTVIAPTGSKLVSFIRKANPKAVIYEVDRGLKSIWKIMHLLNTTQPDILHLHSPRATFIGIIAAKLAIHKATVMATAHGWIPDRLRMRYLYEKIFVYAVNHCDRIIAVSGHVKELLMDHDIKGEKVSINHNGIKIMPTVQPVVPDQKIRKFVFLGRFIEEKGIMYLLQAIEHLEQSRCPKFSVDLYGEGPMLEIIRQTIKEKKLKSVKLYGFVPPEDVVPCINNYDVFLISSIQEGFPYTLIEALSAGVMVISTDVGGINEALIDGGNGYLVRSKDSTSLAKAMEKAIELSNEELYEFKERARQSSYNFTVEQMTLKLAEDYGTTKVVSGH